ncbi:FkbM family methyltransferase [soil metagenome]
MIKVINFILGNLKRLTSPSPVGKIETYLAKYLDKTSPIALVDIGAHKGDFINMVKGYYSVRSAILVEPIPALADGLKSSFQDGSVTVFQNALTDKDGESIEFLINEYEETSSLLQLKSGMKELGNINTNPLRKEMVITRTLDSITKEAAIGIIDLMKIDVQGVEHLVLSGASETLSVTKYVWIEFSFKPLYIGSSVFADIYGLMEKNHFILLEVSPGYRAPNNELLQADALFVNIKYA